MLRFRVHPVNRKGVSQKVQRCFTTLVSVASHTAQSENESTPLAGRKSLKQRKLRRGERWDPQAQLAHVKARTEARQSRQGSRSRVQKKAEEVDSATEPDQDTDSRKSIFVQAKLQQRETQKSVKTSAESEARFSGRKGRSTAQLRGIELGNSTHDTGTVSDLDSGRHKKGPPAVLRSHNTAAPSSTGSRSSHRQTNEAFDSNEERKRAGHAASRRFPGTSLSLQQPGVGAGRGSGSASSEGPQAAQPAASLPLPIRREGKGSTATFFTSESFGEAGATDELVDALATVGITRPSHIQAASLKAVAAGKQHLVLADHSGSGKTLAYLIPLIQQLRLQEADNQERWAKPRRPSVLVVLPTNELAVQVLRVARAVSKGGARFRAVGITGGYKKSTQREQLHEVADMVVGTPGRLATLLQEGHLKLDRCQAVVLDEVDVLLGEASLFHEQVQPLRDSVPHDSRYILATASLPEHTWMYLQGEFPGIRAVLGPGLHRPAPGSLEQLIDCSGGEEINEDTGFERKSMALVKVMKEQGVPRTIVFCNKLLTCRKVENLLKRKLEGPNFAVLAYHTAIDEAKRKRNLEVFLGNPATTETSRMVLVCTDRASRGIDTSVVEHVVLFDFPRDPSEYVRRAGRTARGAGGQGVVSMLVLGRQVKLARQILERNEKGVALHKVPVG